MNFHFENFKRAIVAAGVFLAVAFAQAQTLRPGQPIIFSAPDDSSPASAPSPALEDMIHAPDMSFNPPVAAPHLPAPRLAIVPPDDDRRANWALMTPAEIMGVQTPEEVLQIQERDAMGQKKNLTAAERYYERQDQLQTNGSGFLQDAPAWQRENFLDEDGARLDANNFDSSDRNFSSRFEKPTGQPSDSSDTFQNPSSAADAAAARKAEIDDSGWSKIFVSSPAPTPTPEQSADMAEFEKLLDPQQSEPSKSSAPSTDDGLFSASRSSSGQSAGSPDSFNTKIGGLPGAAQSAPATAPIAPSWKPQPPPWMLKGPQPGVIPKRTF